MPHDFLRARNAFLNMLADCEWEINYDADTNDSGRQVDCSSFVIKGSLAALRMLTDALDIIPAREQGLDDKLEKMIEGE